MESSLPRRTAVPSPSTSWVVPLVLVAGHAVKHAYSSSFYIILPEIRNALDLSNAAVGGLATARNLTGSLVNLPAGFLADRYSNHWGTILGLTMITVGIFQFLMGFTESYWPLMLCSTIAGGAISLWHPAAIAALSQRYPNRRAFALSLHGTGGSIGEAAGPLIAGGLLALLAWNMILRVSLIPALATGAGVWFLLRDLRSDTHGTLTTADYVRAFRSLAVNGPLLLLLLITGLYSAAQGAYAAFLPIYLRIDLGYDSIQTAGFLAAAQVAGIVSQPILGLLSDRFTSRGVLFPALAALAFGLVVLWAVPGGWPLGITIAVLGTVQFPLMSILLSAAMDVVAKEMQGTTTSLLYGATAVFSSLSPFIAGLLADAVGVRVTFLFSAAMALTASALMLLSLQRAGRQAVGPPL